MTVSRRKFIGASAAVGIGAGVLAACGPSDSKAAGSSSSTTTAPGSFESYLQGKGYSAVKAAPLITGAAFNGGLRFDDDTSAYTGKSYVAQQAARVEDVAKKSVPGTLPLFTIVGVETTTPEQANAATELVLGYLTGTAKLDPKQLRVTTTDHSSQFFPLLAKYGITTQQIRLRPWDEAVKDGSGSGYFAPAGHPGNPKAASFSVEYVMPDSSEIEVAEITHGDGTNRTSGGIGVERVEMARTGTAPTWDQTVGALQKAVQAEANRTGAAVPPGLAQLTGSASTTTTG